MKFLCSHPTRLGPVSIFFNPQNGRYHVFVGDEDLGNYPTPQQAVDDICGGHTFSHSSGVDTAQLGIPDELDEWTRAR